LKVLAGDQRGRREREADDAIDGVREGCSTLREGCVDMNVQEQINRYIADQPQSKSKELQQLHQLILGISPNCKLSFSDGRNDENKVVSNPNIGYGSQILKPAGGATKESFRVGLSGNSVGISVYVIGIEDRNYLPKTYGEKIGKAKVTSYCVKFRSIEDINLETLEEIIADHMDRV
jgi:hypothetical protein